jgi:hypothetical protein
MTTVSRRQVILGGAAITGAAWAAPAIVSMDRAFAVGSAAVGCVAPVTGTGTALQITGNVVTLGPLGQSSGAQVCAVDVSTDNVIPSNNAGATATAACGSFAGDTATAYVDDLNVDIGDALGAPITTFEGTITSTATQTCGPGGCASSGTTTLTDVTLGGGLLGTLAAIPLVKGPVALPCNASLFDVINAVLVAAGLPALPSVLADLFTGPFTVGTIADAGLVFNEQICNANGSFTVNGVHVSTAGLQQQAVEDVYISQATVHACATGTCSNPCSTPDPI